MVSRRSAYFVLRARQWFGCFWMSSCCSPFRRNHFPGGFLPGLFFHLGFQTFVPLQSWFLRYFAMFRWNFRIKFCKILRIFQQILRKSWKITEILQNFAKIKFGAVQRLESQVEKKAWQKTTQKMIPMKRAATRRLAKTSEVLTRAQDEVCGATRQHKRAF